MRGLRKVAKHVKRRPVLVVWTDSASNDGWVHTAADFDLEPVEVWTLGWLIAKTKSHLTVTASLADPQTSNESVHGPISIPRVAVRDWSYL